MKRALLPLAALAAAVAAAVAAGQSAPEPEKRPGFLGIAMDAVAIEGSRTAIRVLDVVPGSPAEAARVRPGDLVLALDGEGFPWPVPEAPAKFRERIGKKSPGDRVRLSLRRLATRAETRVADGPWQKAGSGEGKDALPDLSRLLEENREKVVSVRAERATWDREVEIVLARRPGETAKPLPPNPTLRPDLEAAPLEPEAALARRLIAVAGLDDVYDDVRKRLEQDERVEDPMRLATVRYLKRDPLRLPAAAKGLARELAPAAQPGGLPRFCAAAARALDGSTAPVLTTQAPQAPLAGSTVEAHVDYALALMRRARDLVGLALAGISPEERALLVRDLPSLADKFRETIIVHEDEDKERWRRHAKALDLAAKVDPRLLVAALQELAPFQDPAYLDRLAKDLKAAEDAGVGEVQANNQGTHGRVLHESQTDLGPVVVGGSGNNEYRGDYALIIDLGGDDRYLRRAGGATPDRPVGVCVDLDGDDRYSATEPFSQGASFLGIGLLVDRRGDDRYTCDEPFAQGAALAGAAALIDQGGRDEYRAYAYCQGAAFVRGAAALLDSTGDDIYEAGLLAEAFAGPGSFAALVDGAGDDRYTAIAGHKCTYGQEGVFHSLAQGAACGVRGRASGGIAALVDVAGDDRYLGGNFSQGGGYYFGFGLLADLGGGKDRYEGSRYGQGFAAHSALGALWDDGGDDVYTGIVGALQGAAWDLSVAAFLDEGGNDVHDGASGFSLGSSAHNGLSLFYDRSGQDRYRHPPGPARTGPNDYHGGGSLSVFIEAGGQPNAWDVRADAVAFVPSAGIARIRENGGGAVYAEFPGTPESFDEAKIREVIGRR